MPSLGSHTNVYSTCLLILQSKGFSLSVVDEYDADYNFVGFWYAEKNGVTIGGENPIELLGLAAIYEFKGEPTDGPPYWWVVEGPDLWHKLEKEYATNGPAWFVDDKIESQEEDFQTENPTA